MPRTCPSKRVKQREAKMLKSLRESMGLSMRELAKEFKVAPASIAHWEGGKRTVPGPVLRLIEIYQSQQELEG